MQAAYQNVNSYSQKTSVSGRSMIAGRSQVNGMTAEVRYAKPNKVYIIVSAPSTGSVVGMNTPAGMTVFLSQANRFIKMPAASSLKNVVEQLKQFNIAASLDPLYLLEGNSLDPFVSGWALKPKTTINGVSCTPLVGKLTKIALRGSESGNVTFYLDSAFFVHKMTIEWKRLKVKVKVKPTAASPNPAPKQLFMDTTVIETIQDFKINPQLSDADFVHPMPKDAKEQKTMPVK